LTSVAHRFAPKSPTPHPHARP